MRHHGPQAPASHARRDARSVTRATVLIVDDAVLMRSMLKHILAAAHFDVVAEATNGIEAVDKFCEHRPDLVTMDIVMPFRSGIEATRAILAQDPHALIVICSAMGQEALMMEAIEAGAAAYIIKPFRPPDVLGAVDKLLTKSRRG